MISGAARVRIRHTPMWSRVSRRLTDDPCSRGWICGSLCHSTVSSVSVKVDQHSHPVILPRSFKSRYERVRVAVGVFQRQDRMHVIYLTSDDLRKISLVPPKYWNQLFKNAV